jgi:hypothetical protein
MKASGSYDIIVDLESYADLQNLQFFAVATTFALVLATTVVGMAVGKTIHSSWCLLIISCDVHP